MKGKSRLSDVTCLCAVFVMCRVVTSVVVMSLSVSLPPPALLHGRFTAPSIGALAVTVGQALGALLVCIICSAGKGLEGVGAVQSVMAAPLLLCDAFSLLAVLFWYAELQRPALESSPGAGKSLAAGHSSRIRPRPAALHMQHSAVSAASRGSADHAAGYSYPT